MSRALNIGVGVENCIKIMKKIKEMMNFAGVI
jgi:hypothetical protein